MPLGTSVFADNNDYAKSINDFSKIESMFLASREKMHLIPDEAYDICTPVPNEKHDYCSVCKTKFDEYKEHTRS